MRSIFSEFRWKHIVAFGSILVVLICDRFIAGQLPWWNVAASVPPFSILLLPCCIALLAIKAKRKLIIIGCSLIVMLLLIPRADINFHALRLSDTALGSDQASIQVMNWNTEFWDQSEPPGQMYRFLQESNQDIYILEEYEYLQEKPVWKPYLIDKHQELQAQFPDYHVVTKDQFAIVSKYPVTQQTLSPTKQVLWLTFLIDNKPFHVVSVHLEPQVDLGHSIISREFWNFVNLRHHSRNEGLDEIEDFIRQAGDEPLIVTGDFNTTLLMGSLDPLRDQLEDAVKYSKQLFPTTWETKGYFGWRIDHFLYNKHVEIQSYQAVAQLELSDHKALKVKLRLK
ncbi:endonuclease/exonuclease/phosphatase family protein [Paenibacillus silvae]|nr:endonuclease/exonuclease/phosphatase family protein [Paenibacillus silvae]